MHIVIDAQPFLRKEDGVGRYCKELFTALLEQTEHSYELVGFADQKGLPRLLEPSERVTYTFVPVPRRIYSLLFRMRLPFSVNRWLIRKPDLAIYPNFVTTPKINVEGKFVFIHDTVFIDMPETTNKRNLGYLQKFVPSSMLEASSIFAISKFTAKRLNELYGTDKRAITVATPGIDVDHFKPTNNKKILSKYGLREGYILAVGTIEPRKNYDSLIDAYMLLSDETRKNHQLVLAGRPGWRTEALVERIEMLTQEGEAIVITGFFEDDELPALYSHASVFVQPSSYEGFGIPPLEAMACQTPVVSNSGTGLGEAIGDAALTIDPNDPQSISDGLATVLTDKAEAARLIKAGSKQAKTVSWKNSANKLASMIDKES